MTRIRWMGKNLISMPCRCGTSVEASEKEEGDNGQTYTFRFPKEHTEYHYYDEKGTQLSVGVRINDRNNSGRFIYEQEDGKATFPVVMRFKNGSFNNNTFLVGNPFMTHIDVKKFLERNEHIASVKIYDGKNGTANSLIHSFDGDGILEARPGNDGDGYGLSSRRSLFCDLQRADGGVVYHYLY